MCAEPLIQTKNQRLCTPSKPAKAAGPQSIQLTSSRSLAKASATGISVAPADRPTLEPLLSVHLWTRG